MTDQVDVKEIQWQDLEVAEEPRYFAGLGEEAAQIHQELCGGIIDFEERDEPVPTAQERFAEFSAHVREQQEKEFESDSLQGVLVLHGVSEEEFLVAIAQAEAHLSRILSSYPVLSTPNREMTWNAWITEISSDHIHHAALCTPHRTRLTGEWNLPNGDE